MEVLNVVVIGTGMYVSGRGTDGYGTILPALFEYKKKYPLGEIYVAGRSTAGIKAARKKVAKLKREMGIKVNVRFFKNNARNGKDAYRTVMKSIPKPACAIIVVPDHIHKSVASVVMNKGFHTLVVKPLAPTVKDVKELIRIQDKKNIYCAVEFHKRFDLANRKLKDVIGSGKIGDPLYCVVEYSQRKSVPYKRFAKWVKKTNIFQYLGVHYVDIIYFATKAIPKRAMAIGQKGWLASKGMNAYDSVQGIVEWILPSGKKFISCILTNWIDPEKTSAMSDQKIKVIGTKGRFESDQKNRGTTIVTDEKGIEQPNTYFCSPYGKKGNVFYRGYGIESIHQFLNDVVHIEDKSLKIKDLENKRSTFKESLVPTAVLEAVNKSLKNKGKWINIESV